MARTPEPPASRPRKGRKLGFGLLPSLVGYRLRRAQLAVFQNFVAAMAPFDVTPGQFGVLVVIAENPGLSQSELAAAIGIDRSTMVGVIDRLEARGLVVRAVVPRDRRSYALQLSATGMRKLREIEARVRAHEADIARELTAEERAMLLDLLGRLAPPP
jgi:DNA-binding MarR family transcriptional regulator